MLFEKYTLKAQISNVFSKYTRLAKILQLLQISVLLKALITEHDVTKCLCNFNQCPTECFEHNAATGKTERTIITIFHLTATSAYTLLQPSEDKTHQIIRQVPLPTFGFASNIQRLKTLIPETRYADFTHFRIHKCLLVLESILPLPLPFSVARYET